MSASPGAGRGDRSAGGRVGSEEEQGDAGVRGQCLRLAERACADDDVLGRGQLTHGLDDELPDEDGRGDPGGDEAGLDHRHQHTGDEHLVGGEVHEHAERRYLVASAGDPAVEQVAERGDDEDDRGREVGPGSRQQEERHHDRRGQDAAKAKEVRKGRDRARTGVFGHQRSPSLRSVPDNRRRMLSACAITTTSAMSALATTASRPTQPTA